MNYKAIITLLPATVAVARLTRKCFYHLSRKQLLCTVCGLLSSAAFAQTSNPSGLYRLEEIRRQDGEKVDAGYKQYKYCAENVTLQIGYTPEFFPCLPFGFAFDNVDGKPLRVTGELSKTENRGIQVFGDNVKECFTLRWFNDRSHFNEHVFPFNTNTDELYRIVNDSTDAIFRAVNALEMKPGGQQNPLRGVWHLRGRQTKNNARSQYWVERAESDMYLVFGDNCALYVEGNDKFPAGRLNCVYNNIKYLSDRAFELFNYTANVHWFDSNTIAITSQYDSDQPVVCIWDRCGFTQNIQDVFGTKVPRMTKDVSRFYVDYFQNKYGEQSEAVRQSYETYDYAVRLNEDNNAIFPKLMKNGLKQEYEAMRDTLLSRMMRGEIDVDEAVSRYYYWFYSQFDHHTSCEGRLFNKLCKENEIDYHKLIKNYAPKPVACNVDAETFLIRLPSCMGMFPTIEWLNEKIEEYLHSGCKYLILDLRGNNGGNDGMSLSVARLMCDCSGLEDSKSYLRASFFNKAWLRDYYYDLAPEQIKHVLHEVKDVPDGDYSVWSSFPKGVYEYQPKVKRGAIIIDADCASAGETPIAFVHNYSKTHAKVYGRESSEGSDQTGNVFVTKLPNSDITVMIPMTVDGTFDKVVEKRKPGSSPDVIIPLPYPDELTDNIDPWVLWVAKKMKR